MLTFNARKSEFLVLYKARNSSSVASRSDKISVESVMDHGIRRKAPKIW